MLGGVPIRRRFELRASSRFISSQYTSFFLAAAPLSEQFGDRLTEGENRHGTTAVVQEGGFRIDT